MHECRRTAARAPRDHQALRRPGGERRHRPRRRPGRGARPPGRERRRQVDADERALRAVPRRTPARSASTASRCRMRSPRDAIDAGIGMVHQHFMLIPVMTVTENIVLASEPREGPLLDYSKARQTVLDLSQRYGLAVRPDGAGGGDRRRPAAAGRDPEGALPQGAALDPGRADRGADAAGGDTSCSQIVGALKEQGTSIIFITHKLGEVLEVADRITVLRRGKAVATVATAGTTEREPGRADGRPVGAAAGREGRRPARRAPPLGARPGRARQPRPRGRARSLVRGEGGRDRRHRRRRRERPERAGRGDHGARETDVRQHRRRGPRDRRPRRTGQLRGRRRPHPRGSPAPRPRARLHARREPRPARLPQSARVPLGVPASTRDCRARPAASERVRRARRRARHARGLALGRKPAEGRRRARDVGDTPGARGGAADARPRRRRDRVRPPPAGCRARAGPRDPAGQLRARGDPGAV